jgi:DNA-binding MarR family transcriptional regulator
MPSLSPRRRADAAEALVAVSLLAGRWIDRLLARHDPPLTVAQYLALRAIAREDLAGTELARRAGVSGPAVSQLIAGLANGGLVSSQPRPEDRRHQRLELTRAGAQALDSAGAMLREQLGTLIGPMPRPEADALVGLLDRVEAQLAGTPPPRRPPPPAPPPHGHPR